MRNPNRLRQFTIACVSSLQRAPRRTTGFLERAARIKARLVRLFEPGRTTVASVRRLGGTISMRSGSMVREQCVARATSATGHYFSCNILSVVANSYTHCRGSTCHRKTDRSATSTLCQLDCRRSEEHTSELQSLRHL